MRSDYCILSQYDFREMESANKDLILETVIFFSKEICVMLFEFFSVLKGSQQCLKKGDPLLKNTSKECVCG